MTKSGFSLKRIARFAGFVARSLRFGARERAFRSTTRSRTQGFTLIETMFSLVILFIVGMVTILSIIYTRQSMELEKQRLAALSYCRQSMEAAQTNASIDSGSVQLVPFNAPGLEIDAMVDVKFYEISDSGTVAWGTPLDVAPYDKPVMLRVSVAWTPPGTWGSRLQTVSMTSMMRAGTV